MNFIKIASFLLLCVVLIHSQARACSIDTIDRLANQVDGRRFESIQQMSAAVAVVKSCANNDSSILSYAAEKLASRILGQWSYAVDLSNELSNLCRNNSICGKTLASAIGSRINGRWSYSVDMSLAVKNVVLLNRFSTVQQAAIDAISAAINPKWIYSEDMSAILVQISEIEVE